MHPSREQLSAYVDNRLSDPALREEISRHVEVCEFCDEFCREYRELSQPLESTGDAPLPEELGGLVDSLYHSALQGSIIALRQLDSERLPACLAADGTLEHKPTVENLARLYSENPEVVLSVMRDRARGQDYFQITAEDSRLSAHVLVQLPELGREYITDADGRAELDLADTGRLDQIKWQIKMPEAVFALAPFTYDPEQVEYAEEITLQTARHDKIAIRFEGRVESKQLSIKVVELEGRTDFGPVKVVVTQQSKSDIRPASPGVPVQIGPIDPDTVIDIRLYQ